MNDEIMNEEQADEQPKEEQREDVAPVTPSPEEMPKKRRKTRAERKAVLNEKKEQILAQLRKLNALDAKAERKARNHRLIQIGAEVEKVYGKPLEENQIAKFAAFLQNQQERGQWLTKALDAE